ncbi:MAG: enoyl-CoA hydratase/isomerase family protein [Alphaproteobacteria bacterium]|nr:enoyl-CoA hydratase/isomerase family protein [Alphaproteobacteria bacterium]
MTPAVLTRCAHGVCTITLSRPHRLNAINHELLDGLSAALAEADADPETRVVVLHGAGRAFCAGDDLKEFGGQSATAAAARQHIERIQDITRALVCGDKVVVGAVHGWAVGGGLEWTINCDLTIMADDARCFFPEIPLGLFVTGGVTAILPRLAGLQRAKAAILLGERFDAHGALALGIAWKVVPGAALMAEAEAVAARIAALPARAVGDLKRIMNRAATLDFDAVLALETDATVRGFIDPAVAPRVAAFGTPPKVG